MRTEKEILKNFEEIVDDKKIGFMGEGLILEVLLDIRQILETAMKDS